MRIQDLLKPVIFAILTSFAFQYLFFNKSVAPDKVSTFIAPEKDALYNPFNREVDFFDSEKSADAELTDLETDWGVLQFSTQGASLQSIDFKRENNGSIKTIRSLFPLNAQEKQERCFLVALNERTPYYYKLTDYTETDDVYTLSYQVSADGNEIKKIFSIDKHRSKIDLNVEIFIKKQADEKIVPRIFYPSPLMPDIRKTDSIASVVIDSRDQFSKKSVDLLEIQRGWASPKLFGADSRYFIFALIDDTQHFVQRAYYKLMDKDRLFSILEGPAVQNSASWQLSFYFGPKDLHAIAAVDKRLEDTLDYSGILSWISKMLLKLINLFYDYLHNYGFAIIMVTLLMQLALLPLTVRGDEKQFKRQQAEYQRKLAYLKERFKDNPERLAQEQADLIRKEGLPGLSRMLPLLLQIPIFIALNRVLSSSFELYQAPMGWISDLSMYDPYYILPLIVVLAMLLPDSTIDNQQYLNKLLVAVVFGALIAHLPAGLTLYLAASRVFGIVQSRLVNYCVGD